MLDAYIKMNPIAAKSEHGHSITGGPLSSEPDQRTHPYLRPGFMKFLREHQKTREDADRMEYSVRKKFGRQEDLSLVERKFGFLGNRAQRKHSNIQERKYIDDMRRWRESQGY